MSRLVASSAVLLALTVVACARGPRAPASLVDDPCAGAPAYESAPGVIDTVRVQADVREAFGQVRFVAMCVDGGAALRVGATSLNENRGAAARLVAASGRHELTFVTEVETARSATREPRAFVARSTTTVDFDSAGVVTASLVDDDPSGPAFRPRVNWRVRGRK